MNPQLQAILADFSTRIAKLENTPKPLSGEEIDAIWLSYKGDIKDFARAIEERHGIR